MQILTFIQNVVLALMVSVVSLAVIDASTEYVTDLTEIVHMVALRVLNEIAVPSNVFYYLITEDMCVID
jgi:hypothetical protein